MKKTLICTLFVLVLGFPGKSWGPSEGMWNAIQHSNTTGQSYLQLRDRYSNEDVGEGEEESDTNICIEDSEITVSRTTDDYRRSDTEIAGDYSLREAIMGVNNCSYNTTITLAEGTFQIERAGPNEDGNSTGDFDIDFSGYLTIEGQGIDKTIIDADQLDRIFHIHNGRVTLKNMTIQNGKVKRSNQSYDFGGGGILNYNVNFLDGTSINTSLDNVKVTGNTIVDDSGDDIFGGGISHTLGTLTITNSIITENSTTDDYGDSHENLGGGIYNRSTLSIENSAITNNTAQAVGGGGLLNYDGAVTLNKVSVSGNTVNAYIYDCTGAGIKDMSQTDGSLEIINSTISDNICNQTPNTASPTENDMIGVGLSVQHDLTLINSTITNNVCKMNDLTTCMGAGLQFSDNGEISVSNSIVAGNYAEATDSTKTANDMYFYDIPSDSNSLQFYSNGYNLIGATDNLDDAFQSTDSKDLSYEDIFASTTGDASSTTGVYHIPIEEGLAIDKAEDYLCQSSYGKGLEMDQLGQIRSGACDIGAIEVGTLSASTVTGTGTDDDGVAIEGDLLSVDTNPLGVDDTNVNLGGSDEADAAFDGSIMMTGGCSLQEGQVPFNAGVLILFALGFLCLSFRFRRN